MKKRKNRKQTVTDESNPLFDRDDAERSCISKNGYTSEYIAAYQANEQERRNPGITLSWYRCPYCGMWHLTSVK